MTASPVLMQARSVLMQAESVPILQCKRDVVGVRKQSSRGKGLYSEDVHRGLTPSEKSAVFGL
jgi:hypothetical protein